MSVTMWREKGNVQERERTTSIRQRSAFVVRNRDRQKERERERTNRTSINAVSIVASIFPPRKIL